MSLRDIEQGTGIPKTTIREALRRKEKALRKFVRGNEPTIRKPKGKRPGATPYGYGWLEGQLVKDPKEYRVVLEILKLWRAGMGIRAITKQLNDNGVRTRSGKN